MRPIAQAVRQLTHTPTFAVPFVLSVALGVGATTAMFTVANALLFKPIPVQHAQRLIHVTGLDSRGNDAGLQLPLLDQLRTKGGLHGVCGFLTPLSAIEIEGSVSTRSSLALSAGCFETLGVRPAMGRLLGPSDDAPGAPPAAVLSYDAWTGDFDGRHDVLGRPITIDGRPATIVGVTERGFRGLLLGFPARVMFPLRLFQERVAATSPSTSASLPVTAFARMPDGVALEAVATRLRTMWPRLLEWSVPPSYEGQRRDAYLAQQMSVTSAATGIDYALRRRFSTPVLALLSLSVLLLLISCVNVSNLLLLRGVGRRRAVAMRIALGAGRWSLVGEDLIELSLTLAIGVAGGVAMAYAADWLLLALLGSMYVGLDIPLTPDLRTLTFTAMTSILVSVTIAGLLAWTATWGDPRDLLAGGVTRVVGDRGTLRGALVSTQVALALALVSLAALFATSLARLRAAPVGSEPHHVLSAPLVAMAPTERNGAVADAYYRELLDGLARLPDVRGVALTRSAPFFGRPLTATIAALGTRAEPAELGVVTEHFFATLGVSMVSGRSFRAANPAAGPRIEVVVSESLARALSPGGDATGVDIRVLLGEEELAAHVVGVARDAVTGNARERHPRIAYLNFWQIPKLARAPALLVRTAGNPNLVANAVRRELQRRGREYPARIRTVLADRNASLAQEHLLASTAGTFGILGLVLATIGLYGVLNFAVASRREELGLRMALGATRASVVGLVVGRAARLMGLGMALGLPLAFIGVSTVGVLVPEVGTFELAPLLLIVSSMTLAGLLASWVPAWRAAHVTPLEALRGR
jgi:predicted permease